MDKCMSVIFITLSLVALANSGNTFPISDFLETRDRHVAKLITEYMLCSNPYRNKYCCSCKDNCMKFGNCCADKFWDGSITDMGLYREGLIARSKNYTKKKVCDVLFPSKERNGGLYYFMIKTCKDGSTQEEIELCHGVQGDFKTFIPVIGDDRYIYRNVHCAKCNSVKEFSTLNMFLYCVHRNKTASHQFCQVLTDNVHAQQCYPVFEPVRNCSKEHIFYHLCHAFKAPMGKYANFYCYQCNKDYVGSLVTVNKTCGFPAPPSPPFAWSSLLQFTESISTDKDSNPSCKKDDIFDTLINSCFSITCPVGYAASGTKCIEASTTNKNINTSYGNFDSCLRQQTLSLFISGKNETIYLSDRISSLLSKDMNNSNLLLSLEKLKTVNASINNHTVKHPLGRNLDDFFRVTEEHEKIIMSSTKTLSLLESEIDFTQIFPRNRICAEPYAIDTNDILFYTNCSARYKNETIEFINMVMFIKLGRDSVTRHIFGCKKFYLEPSCLLRILSTNNTKENKGTLTEYIDDQVINYDTHEYTPFSRDRYAVCIEHTSRGTESKPDWLFHVETVEAYMSAIGSGISILCYFIIIITFCLFKKLRKIPGLCTMGLSISLLLGDGLFFSANMIRTSYDGLPTDLCRGIGVVTHFALLAAYFWGVIISFDFYTIMTDPTNAFECHNTSRFRKYAIFVIISPITIISVGFVFKCTDTVDIRYANNGVCALHGQYGRIIFLLVPILLALSVSLALITVSIVQLTKENKRNKIVLSRTNVKSADMRKIALKMILVCGLPEIFAFVQIKRNDGYALIANEVFRFTYSFTKSFRGVMLFIVYICRKVVFDLYQQRFETKRVRGVK